MSVEDESKPPKAEEEEEAVEAEPVEKKEEAEAAKSSDGATPAAATTTDAVDDDENKPAKEEESTATFEPDIQLKEVEVKSGTEEEETLHTFRATLFLYMGKKTWKELGVGDASILRHRYHQRLRFLMRQEKTMEVIANHALDRRIVLEPNAGSDRSWVWSCYDVADGELKAKVFAARFDNSELAEEFKNKYDECRNDAPKSSEGGEAEEVAKALGGLTTKDE